MTEKIDPISLWEDTVGDSGKAPTDDELTAYATAVQSAVLKAVASVLDSHVRIARSVSLMNFAFMRFGDGMERSADVVRELEHIWTDDEGQPAFLTAE